MSGGTLIVGASQAGLQLAVTLRENGYEEPITLVGAEPNLPYQRPPLSKSYLTGTAELTSLALRAGSFYEQQRINVVTGERVEELRMAMVGPPGSGTAITDQMHVYPFDRLALTTGARARRLDIAGSTLGGICYLREVGDAVAIRARLSTAHRVVVIGGGFLGLEVAAAARTRGKHVTVVEAADRLMSRSVAPIVSAFYSQTFDRRGVDVRLGVATTEIVGAEGHAAGVALSDGSYLPADLVLVSIGSLPCTELAEQIGLVCEGGIVVDDAARTSEPSIVAAGDCTVSPHPLGGEGIVRLESVHNAVSQARTAALTLLGRRPGRPQVPWFWSDQFDLKLQIAGLSNDCDRMVVRGDPNSEKFSVLCYRDQQLLAINAVNSAADYVVARSTLERGATILPEHAADVGIALSKLITVAPAPTERAARSRADVSPRC